MLQLQSSRLYKHAFQSEMGIFAHELLTIINTVRLQICNPSTDITALVIISAFRFTSLRLLLHMAR